MEKKNTEAKTSISTKTAVKGLINGFVAYSVLIIFLFLALVVIITWAINNNKGFFNYNVLKFTLPTIGAIIIFFLARFICRMSTYDLFKKCKIEKDKIENVSTRMNLFYICCVVFSACVIIVYLLTTFNNLKTSTQDEIDSYYTIYDSSFAEFKENELIQNFESEKSDILIQTLIIEAGLVLGLFSLIPAQRKLIEKYN